MILTCPECYTRYQADEAKFPPLGRDVRCAKCGTVWHQNPPEHETEPVIAEPEPAAPPRKPEPRPQAYVPQPAFEAPPQERTPKPASVWPRRIALGIGWGALAVIILVIGLSAAVYRREIVTAWPPSASLYAKLGVTANASGLRFDDVKYNEEMEDGQQVLAVSGTLVNVSGHELPVPQIRVSLTDGGTRELYHWTFAPDVLTLGAGQTTHFVTRLSSPPAGARHLDLRFAKAGE